MAGISSGKTRPLSPKACEPRISAATSVTAYDSKRSAAMPAQSPTLSPTLSAMVAALRGSSSGMFCSTLPTRSAPTSAALVKMPPPTRMNIASSAAPKPKPSSTFGRLVLEEQHDEAGAEQAETDGEHADHGAGAQADPHGGLAALGRWPRRRRAGWRAPRGSCRGSRPWRRSRHRRGRRRSGRSGPSRRRRAGRAARRTRSPRRSRASGTAASGRRWRPPAPPGRCSSCCRCLHRRQEPPGGTSPPSRARRARSVRRR